MSTSSERRRLRLDDLAPTQTESQRDPVRFLWQILGTGVGLQIIGAVIVGGSWPAASSGYLEPDEVGGSRAGLVVGWLLGSAGTLVLLLALIGFGTMLGIRAAKARG